MSVTQRNRASELHISSSESVARPGELPEVTASLPIAIAVSAAPASKTAVVVTTTEPPFQDENNQNAIAKSLSHSENKIIEPASARVPSQALDNSLSSAVSKGREPIKEDFVSIRPIQNRIQVPSQSAKTAAPLTGLTSAGSASTNPNNNSKLLSSIVMHDNGGKDMRNPLSKMKSMNSISSRQLRGDSD